MSCHQEWWLWTRSWQAYCLKLQVSLRFWSTSVKIRSNVAERLEKAFPSIKRNLLTWGHLLDFSWKRSSRILIEQVWLPKKSGVGIAEANCQKRQIRWSGQGIGFLWLPAKYIDNKVSWTSQLTCARSHDINACPMQQAFRCCGGCGLARCVSFLTEGWSHLP